MINKNIRKTVVEFDNHAANFYAYLFNQLRTSVQKIDRKKEENVFKLQVSKYSRELKRQLDQQAKVLIDTPDLDVRKQLESVLPARVHYYLQEFMLKCNNL
jgi:hypothetical protein